MAYNPRHLTKKKHPRNIVRLLNLSGILFGCILFLGVGMTLFNTLRSRRDQTAFRELAALVEAQSSPGESGAASQSQDDAPIAVSTQPAATPYQILYDQNPDFAAWLTIPGTRIDYPVMHTPEQTEYYIYRAFDGSDSPSGTPFVGDYGDLDSQTCIIYGHNMADGTMFHDLLEYLEKAFWQENPTFTIATPEENREYEIFAAVQTRVLSQEESGLRFYRLEKGVEDWLKKRSLYDTGITPEEGDSIVILSTCSYHTQDGRFLIAGRLAEKTTQ